MVPGLIKAPLRPPPGFSLFRGPEAPRRPMAGEEMCERPPPKGEAGRRCLGGDCAARTRVLPPRSPSDVTRATSRGSQAPSPPSSPPPTPLPSAWRASGRRDSADFWAPEEMGMGWGPRKSGWLSPKTARFSFPPAGPSGGPGQPQLPVAVRQRVLHCNRILGLGDCPPGRRRGRRGQAPGAQAGSGSGCPGRRVSPPRPRSIPAGQAPGTRRANVARECARARPRKRDQAGTRSGRRSGRASLGMWGQSPWKTPWRRLSSPKSNPSPGCRPPRSFPSLPILPARSPLLNLGAFSPTPTPLRSTGAHL